MRLLLAGLLAFSLGCTKPESFVGKWAGTEIQTGSCDGERLPPLAERQTILLTLGTTSDLESLGECELRFSVTGGVARLDGTPGFKCAVNVAKRRAMVIASYTITPIDSTHLSAHQEYTALYAMGGTKVTECDWVVDAQWERQ